MFCDEKQGPCRMDIKYRPQEQKPNKRINRMAEADAEFYRWPRQETEMTNHLTDDLLKNMIKRLALRYSRRRSVMVLARMKTW